MKLSLRACVLALTFLGCGSSSPNNGIQADPITGDAAADAADAAPDTATPVVADAASPVDAAPAPVADAAPPADAAPAAACGSSGSCGPRSTCVAGACVAGNRVFVTSGTFSALLGGPLGADTDCQTAATNAALGGTWKAWVAGSQPGDPSPATDFKFATSYQLVDGTIVGGLNPPGHAIDEDETGSPVSAAHVWTNTTSAGTSLPTACGDMNSADPTLKAGYGRTDLTGALNAYPSWSYAGVDTCDTKNRLYCFEQ